MFPDETHVKIVKDIDDAEAQAFSQYRRLARMRLKLMEQWRVLPSGERWTPTKQREAEEAVK